MANRSNHTWSWWEILLWGYAMLIVGGVIILIFFFPSVTAAPSPEPRQDEVFGAILFIPVLIFLILQGIKHLKD